MPINIYENTIVRVEVEASEVPWLKVLTQREHKEFSECSTQEKSAIFEALDVIEKEMLAYYQPTKINIASFGNYMPIVHWHIMARFENDSYFPEPMWGTKQREGTLKLPSFETFYSRVARVLTERLEHL